MTEIAIKWWIKFKIKQVGYLKYFRKYIKNDKLDKNVINYTYFGHKVGYNCADIAKLFAEHFKGVNVKLIFTKVWFKMK